MIPDQLAFDLAPVGAVCVGDRVRVLARPDHDHQSYFCHTGQEGVVTQVRPTCPPGSGSTWLPVIVLLDGYQLPQTYAFDHDALEILARAGEVPS